MRIVILGAPGSGKKTQSALLAEKLNLSIVSTGDLLKRAITEKSLLGVEAKAQQDAGHTVTEDIILGLLRDEFLDPAMSAGFILDGFPRNLLQALTLDELLIELEIPLNLVILLEIDVDNLMERLVGRCTCRSCNQLYNAYRNPPIVDGVCDICGGRLHRRSDDNEETVSNRIHVFDHLVAPLITHYEKSGILVRVDGNGELETVFQGIIDAIESARVKSATGIPAQSGSANRTEGIEVAQAPVPVRATGKGLKNPEAEESETQAVEAEKTPVTKVNIGQKVKAKTKAAAKKKKTTTASGKKSATKQAKKRLTKKHAVDAAGKKTVPLKKQITKKGKFGTESGKPKKALLKKSSKKQVVKKKK